MKSKVRRDDEVKKKGEKGRNMLEWIKDKDKG